jgi:hypothetical protein
VVRVHERHREREVALQGFDGSTPAIAVLFMRVYDLLKKLASDRMQEREQAQTALDDLLRKERVWALQIAMDVPGVYASDYGDNPHVPDEVINDADSLIEIGTKHLTVDGEPLPYAEALAADLGGAVEIARKEWMEAEQAQDGYTQARNECREVAVKLEKGLIAYRRALAEVIGRAHPDFQKLRVERARTRDVDDDEGAAALPYDDEDEGAVEEPVAPPIDAQSAGEAQVSP